jgi:hypothetical protein
LRPFEIVLAQKTIENLEKNQVELNRLFNNPRALKLSRELWSAEPFSGNKGGKDNIFSVLWDGKDKHRKSHTRQAASFNCLVPADWEATTDVDVSQSVKDLPCSKSNEFGRPLGPVAVLSKLKGSGVDITSLFNGAFSATVEMGNGDWNRPSWDGIESDGQTLLNTTLGCTDAFTGENNEQTSRKT